LPTFIRPSPEMPQTRARGGNARRSARAHGCNLIFVDRTEGGGVHERTPAHADDSDADPSHQVPWFGKCALMESRSDIFPLSMLAGLEKGILLEEDAGSSNTLQGAIASIEATLPWESSRPISRVVPPTSRA
jgi:hypothetical protein